VNACIARKFEELRCCRFIITELKKPLTVSATVSLLCSFVFCLHSGIIVLTSLANRVRLVRLSAVDQFILAYGGLRGAIAFALAVLLDEHVFPDRHLFITTTIVIIYFTNFVMVSRIIAAHCINYSRRLPQTKFSKSDRHVLTRQ
jgi:NhaP-type Na+/H+ or K+/H+ antiporter